MQECRHVACARGVPRGSLSWPKGVIAGSQMIRMTAGNPHLGWRLGCRRVRRRARRRSALTVLCDLLGTCMQTNLRESQPKGATMGVGADKVHVASKETSNQQTSLKAGNLWPPINSKHQVGKGAPRSGDLKVAI